MRSKVGGGRDEERSCPVDVRGLGLAVRRMRRFAGVKALDEDSTGPKRGGGGRGALSMKGRDGIGRRSVVGRREER